MGAFQVLQHLRSAEERHPNHKRHRIASHEKKEL
ncbi:hypothetical protein J2S31_000332 [Nitrospina gracilis Nb-211]|nr:hypothetical protein [Nitrospina gracilis Nb-211]